MTTVQNNMKDRCVAMRLTDRPGEYEYGWVVYNRRDRTKDRFVRVGVGFYSEARNWMDNPGVRISKYKANDLVKGG